MNTVTRSQLSRSTAEHTHVQAGRTKPAVSADYIVGLTDGEGCFYVNIWQSSARKAGSGVQMHFHIKMNARDRDVLEQVREVLRCGNVYFQHETRANHAQCYRYTVGGMKNITEKVIPFFQKHPLHSASKQASFEIFCTIADLMASGAHLHAEGIEEIRKLKKLMNQKTAGLA